MGQEIERRRALYKAKLSKVLLQEEQVLKKSNIALKRFQQLVERRSREAQRLALNRVRGFKAQLELGPILQDYWIKEIATDLLERARMMNLRSQYPLRLLKDQEVEAPPSLSTLDVLTPAINQYIVNPIPDPEKN